LGSDEEAIVERFRTKGLIYPWKKEVREEEIERSREIFGGFVI
jgi:hypothetical protein